jgi:small-conductance mechanosensitive channel
MELGEMLLNPYVILYLLIVFGSQILIGLSNARRRKNLQEKRRKEGLPPDIIMDHSERLSVIRSETIWQSSILVAAILVVPLLLLLVAKISGAEVSQENGLAIVFIGLLLWVVLNGTDVAKAFLGGLAFKTLVAFKNPLQVGDRVSLKGYSGKVLEIGIFYVTLQTPDDDLVSLPTSTLWSEVLVSANAGERSSLCVMNFYIAPFATQEQRQEAEDTIWDAIQASPYLEVSKPMQIFLSQNLDSIQLTAKAYVASTYNEPLFKSDVTRAFLDFVTEKTIPLASPAWRLEQPVA